MGADVHHSHKPHGNGWTEYLFEFLMVFLAVYFGFLAENIRERKVEKETAEISAKNLYKELIADSIVIQQMIEVRKIKESECAYFISYVVDSNLTTLNNRFYRSFSWAFLQTGRMLFEPEDGILSQLKYSGELSYFKSAELQKAIGELSVAIANVRARNEREYLMVEFYTRPFSIKYFDFAWLNALTRNGQVEFTDAMIQNLEVPINGKIPNLDDFDRKEAENMASYYLLMLRSTRMAQYAKYTSINQRLLDILRKEYPSSKEPD